MIAALLLAFQATYVVDDDGGVGVDFSELPAAVAAASDGDRLLVRAGHYAHFALAGKGLTILGAGASTRVELAGAGGGMMSSIADVPRGSYAYLEGLDFAGVGFAAARLEVRGATTRVALRQVAFAGPIEDFYGRPAVRVEAAELVLQDCTLDGGPGHTPFASSGGPGGIALMAGLGARVLAFGTTFRGGPGVAGYAYAGGGGAALVLYAGRVLLAGCTVVGGPGAFAPSGDVGAGGLGLIANDGALVRVMGGDGARIEGGQGACPATDAIHTNAGGRVVVHAVEVLTGYFAFGGCDQGAQTSGFDTARGLPELALSGSFTLAGTLTVTLHDGPPLAPFTLSADAWPGRGRPPFAAELPRRPVVGEWFVLGGTRFTGILSATGDFQASFPAALLGSGTAPFALQASVVLPDGRRALSGAALGLLR